MAIEPKAQQLEPHPPCSTEGLAVAKGFGLGVSFTEGVAGPQLLLLQDQIDYLLRLDLASGLMAEVELPAAPVSIGSLPGGPFFITHTSSLGLVSFLGTDGTLTSGAGFAVIGLGEETPVSTSETEGE
jgi:hypothetical protein